MNFFLVLKMCKIGVLLFLGSKKPENRSDSWKKGVVCRYDSGVYLQKQVPPPTGLPEYLDFESHL